MAPARPAKLETSPRFYEVDSYGVVNNMFYQGWCEMGRFEVARLAHLLSDRRFESENIRFVVVEADFRYRHPVGLEQPVVIETLLGNPRSARLEFHHKVRAKANRTLCLEARTSVVCTRPTGMLLALPRWIHEKLSSYIQDVQGEFDASKLALR